MRGRVWSWRLWAPEPRGRWCIACLQLRIPTCGFRRLSSLISTRHRRRLQCFSVSRSGEDKSGAVEYRDFIQAAAAREYPFGAVVRRRWAPSLGAEVAALLSGRGSESSRLQLAFLVAAAKPQSHAKPPL